jgi:hypothetical protein
METTENTIPNTAAASDAATLGQQLLEAVIALEAIVPELISQDPREQRRVASGAKFAHLLIAPTITTVTSSPALKDRKLFDVERGRAALQFRDEIRPVAQRLAAFVSPGWSSPSTAGSPRRGWRRCRPTSGRSAPPGRAKAPVSSRMCRRCSG